MKSLGLLFGLIICALCFFAGDVLVPPRSWEQIRLGDSRAEVMGKLEAVRGHPKSPVIISVDPRLTGAWFGDYVFDGDGRLRAKYIVFHLGTRDHFVRVFARAVRK